MFPEILFTYPLFSFFNKFILRKHKYLLTQYFKLWEQYEITCVLCMNVARLNFVAAGGWNKKVQKCSKV